MRIGCLYFFFYFVLFCLGFYSRATWKSVCVKSKENLPHLRQCSRGKRNKNIFIFTDSSFFQMKYQKITYLKYIFLIEDQMLKTLVSLQAFYSLYIISNMRWQITVSQNVTSTLWLYCSLNNLFVMAFQSELIGFPY